MRKDSQGPNEYEVGYRKPPKQTQFKRGVSGNPKGRQKKCFSATDVFNEVFNSKVKVTINGQSRYMTPMEGAFLQLSHKIMSGDLRAMRMYITFIERLGINTKSNELNPQLQALADAMKAGPVPTGMRNEEDG